MQQQLKLGTATIEPAGPVEAGSYATIELTYTADHPIDDTGYLKICFRHVGDFGTPQFTEPQAPNYCTVRTSGDCRITPRWDAKGNTRPWTRSLYLQVGRGYLAHGQTVTVTFGDRSGGSPGWRVQTFGEETFEFKCLVDPIATYEFKELPESPIMAVVAGPPARSLCLAPSQVLVGEHFDYHLKTEDRWGNPVGLPARHRHQGFDTPGVGTVLATDPLTGFEVESNPIAVVAERPALGLFWADLHGQSEETIGTNSIADYHRFGRDYALLDAVGHQGNDFQITDEFWTEVQRVADDFYKPGRLVTFAGFEWSGNTPLGGDRNIYFAAEGGRIVHSSTDLLPGKETAYPIAPTADQLFAALRAQPAAAPFGLAHVGGRFADIAMHDPAIEVAMEIHSAWGTFEWLLEEALRRGYRVGVVANSDGHKCRPGASYPGAGEFGSLGGLTCVLAARLDRESVAAALRARRCYATTGHRPLLAVSVVSPDGRVATTGEVVSGFLPGSEVSLHYVGTAPVEQVEVRCGSQVVSSLRPAGGGVSGRRVKVAWSGAEVRGRARVARWDGCLTVRGNSLAAVTPVNFWDPDHQPQAIGPAGLEWRSSTTGGLAGLILELERPGQGTIEVRTAQGDLVANVADLALEPTVLEAGGLRKRLAVGLLPEARAAAREVRLAVPLGALAAGDNPVYVRVTQEDGHMTWSSPIYLVP